ncbi:MAG: NAD-dependent epimerase/dehydratase family protein [Planctomycetes bacterium]|nr:NAD-dependent epimerase/dehydratase family protein [Planctomycetota bacterium]
MARILVTGATGFIGSRLVKRLLGDGDGHAVSGMVRDPEKARPLFASGMRPVLADVTRELATLERALTGAEVVFHLAAVTGPAPLARFAAVNVEGTRKLLEAARRAGVRRFVNVASQAVLFAGKDLVGVDEEAPYPDRYIDPYSETKAEAERLVLSANQDGFETTSVRPCLVWGAGDTTVLPNFVGLSRGFGIPLPGPGDREEATTHVENLVDGLLLAASSPKAPGRAYYIADGFEVRFRDFLELQLRAVGVEPKFRRIPYPVAAAVAWLADVPPRWIGAPVALARFGLRAAVTGRRVRTLRAREELGYAPRIGLEEGLADLAADRDRYARA